MHTTSSQTFSCLSQPNVITSLHSIGSRKYHAAVSVANITLKL